MQKSRVGFRTRKDAEAAAATILTELNQGTFILESNILFRDFTETWLATYIERNAPKPGTMTIRLRQ